MAALELAQPKRPLFRVSRATRRMLWFAAWALWLASPMLLFGPGSYVRIPDNADSNLAVRLLFGHLPVSDWFGWWNPFGNCGNSALISGLFPLDIEHAFFAVFPGWLAYGLFAWLQRFIAGWFTYLLCIRVLRLPAGAALAAGMGYALFYQPWLDRSWDGFALYDRLGLPALPLILYVISRLPTYTRKQGVALAVLTGIFLGLGSHFAFGLFMVLAIILWALFVTPLRTGRNWLMLAALVACWALVEFPGVWATHQLVAESHRAMVSYRSAFFTEIAHYPILVRNLVLYNILFVLLGLAGGIVTRFHARYVRFFLIALAILCFYLLGYNYLTAIFTKLLGSFSGFRFERFYILAPLLCVLAGATGLASLTRRFPHVRRYLPALTYLLLVGLSCYVLVRMHTQRLTGANYRAIYMHPLLRQLADRMQHETPSRAVVVGASPGTTALQPGYLWPYGIETADGYTTLYPKRYHEFWSEVLAPLFARAPERQVYFEHWGNAIYLFPPTQQRPARRIDTYYDLSRLAQANVRYFISESPLHHDRLSLVMHDAGSRQYRSLYIYEYADALPRVYVPQRVKVHNDPATVSEAYSAADAVIDRQDLPQQLPRIQPAGSEVRDIRVSTQGLSFIITSPASLVFVASVPYQQGWRATAGNTALPLFPINHAFTGGIVPAGTHTVDMRYSPW